MKPEPLDLDLRCGSCKFCEWQRSNNTHTCSLTEKVVRRDFTCELIEKLKIMQRIKQACGFYLRYKDKPELLMKERDREYLYLKELCTSYEGKGRCKVEHTLCRFPACIWFSYKDVGKDISIEQYNEWLFKLAFKDVFKSEADDGKVKGK